MDQDRDEIPRHPLDAAPPAIVKPSSWTAEWVGYRLIIAFQTLARLRDRGGPRAFGTAMPAYIYEAEDLISQREMPLKIYSDQNAVPEAVRIEIERRNRPSAPTSEEINLMEQALSWPHAHLKGLPGFAGCLNIWAEAASREIDFADLLWARNRRVSAAVGGFIAREAMRVIADRLRKERVEVS